MNTLITILYGDDERIIFEVPSNTDNTESYLVTWDFDNGWLCTCKGCLQGRHLCRHILAAEEYMKKMNMALLDDPTVFTGGLVG